MRNTYFASLTLSLIMTGAIFGFFYAYIASGINGLNSLPAPQAIISMNAINDAVRNAVFFPFFFLTPLVCFLSAWLAHRAHYKRAAVYLLIGGVVYLVGGMGLTMMTSVPLNEALKLVDPSILSADQAVEIWQTYANDWSFWNVVRTVFSGVALLCIGLAIYVSK